MYEPSKHMVIMVFWWFENEVSSLPPDKISHTLILFPPKKNSNLHLKGKIQFQPKTFLY